MNNYDRHILALNDIQLEQFVREWVALKDKNYFEVTRFSGTGDMGRDVVGFLTAQKHEGPWHNYQCKQYNKNLPTATALLEIGKILYYSFQKKFTPPVKYCFVAPKGINRNLQDLIYNPSILKQKIIQEWDVYCGSAISEDGPISLTPELQKFVESFDFTVIGRITLDDILLDPSSKPLLFKMFGENLGSPPEGEVPEDIQEYELPYVTQLVEAYGERNGSVFKNHQEIKSNGKFQKHLDRQRVRFHDADAFKRFYRDSIDPAIMQKLESDIHHGIIDVHEASHQDTLTCVDAVMSQAGILSPAGPLAGYAHIPVKQGLCHHFANQGTLIWKK